LRDAQIEAIDTLVDVARAVTRLTARQRAVLALAVEGWTQEEIGARLGIERSVATRHLMAARKKLAAYTQSDALLT
jgi:DNA-directed RNA polymerase specialized sigma24 family protein